MPSTTASASLQLPPTGLTPPRLEIASPRGRPHCLQRCNGSSPPCQERRVTLPKPPLVADLAQGGVLSNASAVITRPITRPSLQSDNQPLIAPSTFTPMGIGAAIGWPFIP